MVLYDADSPAMRCLRMFLLEQGLQIPSVKVDVFAGDNRQAPFTDLNPAGQTPVLALTGGSALALSVAIAEYLDELHPAPALIGAIPSSVRSPVSGGGVLISILPNSSTMPATTPSGSHVFATAFRSHRKPPTASSV